MDYRIFIICLVLIIGGCSQESDTGRTAISGKINGMQESKVLLTEMKPFHALRLDSLKTDRKGLFSFRLNTEETGFYNLVFEDGSILTLIAGDGDKIDIKANANDIEGSYSVHGSEESDLLREYLMHTLKNKRKADSLGLIFESSKETPEFHIIRGLLEQAYTKIYIDQQEYTRNFIQDHPSSMASLIALNNTFGTNKVLDEEYDLHLFEMVDIGLASKYPENSHYLNHQRKVGELRDYFTQRELAEKYTAPGMIIPDFSLPGLDGKKVAVRDFRGETLLIYCWASWDARSRQMNRKLPSIIHTAYPEKINVLALSFDQNPDLWRAAIRIDSLNFTHVSDLSGPGSPVTTLLNIPSRLPFYILVSADGTIISKGNDPEALKIEISNLKTQQ
ncbi:MAG: AhpC/TSA family protein [Bacteroidetes bacterium]|nr:AhpC/TSA family protein [Bacteroidota bacterium]